MGFAKLLGTPKPYVKTPLRLKSTCNPNTLPFVVSTYPPAFWVAEPFTYNQNGLHEKLKVQVIVRPPPSPWLPLGGPSLTWRGDLSLFRSLGFPAVENGDAAAAGGGGDHLGPKGNYGEVLRLIFSSVFL